MNAKESLKEQFNDGALSGLTLDGICKTLKIPYREKKSLLRLLDALIEDGVICETRDGIFGTPEDLGLIKGVLRGNERGFAFLVPDDKEKYPNDFFIPHRSLHGALHGDKVFAEQVLGRSDDEAEVVSILERGFKEIVGTFKRDK